MRLSAALEDKKLDLRLRDKLVAEGKIDKTDLTKYLNDLQDDQANSMAADQQEVEVVETPTTEA